MQGHPQSVAVRLWSNVDSNGPVVRPELGPCWVWEGYVDPKGYGRITISHVSELVHRVAWFVAYGKWPKPNALHRCDNRACVRLAHLFEGSNKDNTEDMLSKGREACGEKHGHAKLRQEQVDSIRTSTNTQSALAREYGVSRSLICQIKKGLRWRKSKITKPTLFA